MKRTWITWPIVGGLILLLTAFLFLQYRWQMQAGDAEREIIQKRVEGDTRQFAEDFNREIQAAYFNFQMDAEAWNASDSSEFNERYDYWRSKTQYPELIHDFYFIRPETETCLHYDSASRTFIEQAMPREVAEVKTLVSNDATLKPIYADRLTLALPIHPSPHRVQKLRISAEMRQLPRELETPKPEGFLLIFLDRNVVEGRLLPELAAKHFPGSDFRIDVKDKDRRSVFQTDGEIAQADASERLLTMSPDNLIFFANKDILPRSADPQSSLVVSQHVESHTFGRVESESNTKTFTFEVNADGPRRKSAIFTSVIGDGDGWALGVQHKSGSVGAFVSGEQNRKMLTGLSIYLLVIGAIVAIAYSAMRSQKFAQRQIEFVSSVSHEFRTPLAVIYSAGENLADGVANDRTQVEKYGSLIKSEGRKLSAMVEQILEFAGARSGNRKYTFSKLNVNDVVRKSLVDHVPELEADSFTVETELDPQLPAIAGDAEALTSAVQNLIQNAAKYSNGDRWIRVSTSKSNGCVAIEVRDRGIGISAGELGKIFEPFYRSKEVVDSQIHGNGLGLSLVREIAEAHGGTVRARSEKGKGSEFTIELPAAPESINA